MPSPLVSSQSVAAVRQADAATLADWDRTHVWHAFTQMAEYEPLLIERGEGAALFDIDGNRYLDGSASMWCNVHGHHHPRLDRAAREQLEKVAHCTNLGLSNPVTVQLAKRLTEIAPAGLEKVFFSDDGATAIEVALKMAFQFWRQASPAEPTRQRFLSIGEAYHGDTLGTIGVGGVARFGSIFGSLTYDAIRVPSPAVCRQPKGMTPEDACRRSLEQVAAAFEAHRGEIAAVVMEPIVQAAGGILVHPPGFLHGMRELTRAHDILLILDEVAMGFGRTGTMFACEQEDVSPDILCLGKGLTAGYLPMAATLTTDAIWRAFLGSHSDGRAFYHGHTFGGNPLAAAVALESLAVFRDEAVLQQLAVVIKRLRIQLQQLAELPHVGGIRQCGLMAGIDLVANKKTGETYPWAARTGARACLAAREHGALLRQLGDTVVIMPPLSISTDEIDTLVAAAAAGITAVTQPLESLHREADAIPRS